MPRLALLLVLLLLCPALGREPAELVRVVDGDTLRVRLPTGREVRVRLIGIDTPEVRKGQHLSRQELRLGLDPTRLIEVGKQASARVGELVGERIFLEYDQDRQDRYGRDLAYVWLDENTMLNEQLLAEGLATPESVPPNLKNQALFEGRARAAREAGLGLWGPARKPEAEGPSPAARQPDRPNRVEPPDRVDPPKRATEDPDPTARETEGPPGWLWPGLILVSAALVVGIGVLGRKTSPPQDDEPIL